MRIRNRGGVAFEDLTARVRVRDAALEHFAEYGFDRATIRGIASAAWVSPGLVRHHFGSEDGLRKACDAYALQALRSYVEDSLTEEGIKDPDTIAEASFPLHPLQRYLARALIDESETAGQIFDDMVTMTEHALKPLDDQRPDQPVADLRTRAALTVAMALGTPAFQSHIARSVGADLSSPDGERRITLALLDLHSHPAISPENANKLQQGLEQCGRLTGPSATTCAVPAARRLNLHDEDDLKVIRNAGR